MQMLPSGIEGRLVNGGRHWWKRWSVKLAGSIAALTTLILSNQGLALALLNVLPGNSFARLLIAIGIGVVIFVIPTLTVLWKQDNLHG